MRGGAELDAAMRAENSALVQVRDVNLRRAEVRANARQGLPASLVLFFSMAQGSTKVLEDADDLGWYVVWMARYSVFPSKAQTYCGEDFCDDCCDNCCDSCFIFI